MAVTAGRHRRRSTWGRLPDGTSVSGFRHGPARRTPTGGAVRRSRVGDGGVREHRRVPAPGRAHGHRHLAVAAPQPGPRRLSRGCDPGEPGGAGVDAGDVAVEQGADHRLGGPAVGARAVRDGPFEPGERRERGGRCAGGGGGRGSRSGGGAGPGPQARAGRGAGPAGRGAPGSARRGRARRPGRLRRGRGRGTVARRSPAGRRRRRPRCAGRGVPRCPCRTRW